MGRLHLALAAAMFGLVVPAGVRAHALPAGIELAWPGDAATRPWVLTSRGLVLTSAAGAELRCNEAFFVNTSAFPSLYATDGYFAVATQSGVVHSSDHGCSLPEATGLPDLYFGGFAVLADAAQTMLVSTAAHDPLGGVFASLDHGVTFARRSVNVDQEAFTELMGAPSVPTRVYATGFRFDASSGKVLDYVWAVSDDGASTFARTSMSAQRVLLGVSPTDPQTVFAYQTLSADTGAVSIQQSTDGGQSFVERVQLVGRPAFAADPSGTTFWLGAAGSAGLFVSHDSGATFASTRPELTSITCLAHHGDAVYACARHYPLELGVWSAASDSAELTQELVFEQVTEPVMCGAAQDICAMSWSDWSYELLSGPPSTQDAAVASPDASSPSAPSGLDASLPAAPSAVDSGSPTTAHPSSGCQVGESADRAASSFLFGLILLGLTRLRRRRAQCGAPA